MVHMEKWVLLWVGCFFLLSCAQLRANNERHYYRQALWELKEIPKDTSDLCGYDYSAPYPAFVANEDIATDFDSAEEIRKDIPLEYRKQRPNLSRRIIVNYNPAQMEKIRHESVHYLNRMKKTGEYEGVTYYDKVSWDCLDEMLAQAVANNLLLRDMLNIQRAKTRHYRHKASGR